MRVVLGDLCSRPSILGALSTFFVSRQRTRLHLDYEAVSGPFERLRDGTADLIFHRADGSSYDFEHIKLCEIRLLSVINVVLVVLPPSAIELSIQRASVTLHLPSPARFNAGSLTRTCSARKSMNARTRAGSGAVWPT